MDVAVIEDNLVLPTKREVLKLHILTKLRTKRIPYTENELDVLVELSEFGGYDENSERDFLNRCVELKYRGSVDSTANVISKYVLAGVILKKKKRVRDLNPEFLPPITSKTVGLSYKIVNHAEK